MRSCPRKVEVFKLVAAYSLACACLASTACQQLKEVGADGSRLYASNEDAGTASVIDLKTGRTLATFVVGTEPEGCRVSPDGRWVYVTLETGNVVSVIDAQTNAVVSSFLVASRPRDLAFSPDGTRAYVTTEVGRTLEVVDTSTRAVVRTVWLPRGAGACAACADIRRFMRYILRTP